MMPPGAARHLIKLLPIAFVPGRHFLRDTFYSTHWMPRGSGRFTCYASFLWIPLAAPIPSYSYTSRFLRQSIFLACCIKHVTGTFVSDGISRRLGGNPCQKTCAFGSSLAIPAEVNTHLSEKRVLAGAALCRVENLRLAQTCRAGFSEGEYRDPGTKKPNSLNGCPR